MKLAVFTILLFSFVPLCSAQSRRVPAGGTGKSNTRTATPSPTPTPVADVSFDDDGDIVKVETNVVTVPVRVLDRKGRFVAGLTKENFRIYEDGAEREIAYFSGEQEPFTVALVLDMSYSTKFQIAEIQNAAVSFIAQLGPRDKVMVVSFDQNVHILTEPTSDRSQIYRAIRSTKIATGTSLYEALDIVMNTRLNRIKGRKAIILFTDGVDTTSTRSNDLQNLSDAMELDALIYPIRYDTFQDVQRMKDRPVIVNNPPTNTGPFPGSKPGSNPIPILLPTIGTPGGPGTSADDYRRAADYLEQLAVRTGGRSYLADSFGNLSSAYSKIASELREYYSLGFYPPEGAEAGKLRRLKVKIDKPELAVRSRDSYVIGKPRKRR